MPGTLNNASRRLSGRGVHDRSEPGQVPGSRASRPSPAETLLLELRRHRDDGTPFNEAWPKAVPIALHGLVARDRKAWQIAFSGTRHAWQACYEGRPAVTRLVRLHDEDEPW